MPEKRPSPKQQGGGRRPGPAGRRAARLKLSDLSDQIEGLLEEVRSMASPPVWERVEEIVRAIARLYGEGPKRIDELVMADTDAGERLRSQIAADDLVSSLLILHGIHPKDFETRVREALQRVRPYLLVRTAVTSRS